MREKIVFVGGASVSLYADDFSSEARPTKDVDVVVEVMTYSSYAEIDKQFIELGFKNDMTSNIICRYIVQDIIVDVMPTTGEVLGFKSRWYSEGFKTAIDYTIDKEHVVKIFDAPFFIASKLEAFKERGKGNGITSKDFEDIVYILENRANIWEELRQSAPELRKYLMEKVKALLATPYFDDWVDAHTEWGSPPASYMILEQFKEFIS